jgi:hypothetical protein
MWFGGVNKTVPEDALGFMSPPLFEWVLGSVCSLHRLPFSRSMLGQHFPCGPDQLHNHATFYKAAQLLGLKVKRVAIKHAKIGGLPFPFLVNLNSVPPTSKVLLGGGGALKNRG